MVLFSGYQAWRRLSDLVSTIYAAGLHLENESTENFPFFLRQWRRRCFIAAFSIDKVIATFVGRPPLMNGRFCTLAAPLDLDDETLVAGGDLLDKAISKLDSAGWNTEGLLHTITPTRLRYQLAIIREETLELVLGTHEQRNLIQMSKYIYLLVRGYTTWLTLFSSIVIFKQKHAQYGQQLQIIFDMIDVRMIISTINF